jgi:hypothetical protein
LGAFVASFLQIRPNDKAALSHSFSSATSLGALDKPNFSRGTILHRPMPIAATTDGSSGHTECTHWNRFRLPERLPISTFGVFPPSYRYSPKVVRCRSRPAKGRRILKRRLKDFNLRHISPSRLFRQQFWKGQVVASNWR